MKKVSLLCILTIFFGALQAQQHKISGLVFININNSVTRPAMGTMIYVYPINNKSDFDPIQKYLDACSDYGKYNASLFHPGKSVDAYKRMKELKLGADSLFSIMLQRSKSTMVNAQGEYSIDGLNDGTYIVFFYDKNFYKNHSINKKHYSQVVDVDFKHVAIVDKDEQLNYTYQRTIITTSRVFQKQ